MQAGSEEGAQPENIDVAALPLPDNTLPGPLPVVPELGDWLTPQKPITVGYWPLTQCLQCLVVANNGMALQHMIAPYGFKCMQAC